MLAIGSIIVAAITVVFVWVVGALLTLKVDAMFCDDATDYNILNITLALCLWPAIGFLHLRCKHRTGTFVGHTDQNGITITEVYNEQWEY